MNTILTILTIYGFMDFVKLPWPPVSSQYIYVSCLSAFAKLRDAQLHVVIGLIHTLEHIG